MTALSQERVGRITGSRIGAIIGANRYQTADDVLTEMVAQARGQEALFQGNDATAWGNDHETEAIALYEQRHQLMVWGGQDLVIHPVYDFLACTPDGLVGDDGMVEVKCPYTGRYTRISEKPEHEAQIRLQLECTGRAWCDYIVWRTGSQWREPQLDVSRVEHDPAWLPKHLPVLLEFMDRFRSLLALTPTTERENTE